METDDLSSRCQCKEGNLANKDQQHNDNKSLKARVFGQTA